MRRIGELDAELLGVPVGSPVLVCRRVTADLAGTPVLIGDYVFPAHRTEFTVELASTEPSIAPGGLRLLEQAPPDGAPAARMAP